jgi:hypothetical protein
MPASPDDAEIDVVLNMLARESSDSAPAEIIVVTVIPELDKTVDTRKPEGTRQSILARSAAQLRLLRRRRRKRDGFGDCHAWTRMLDLLLLFVKKYQQRSLLKLIPMMVYLLNLTPMGVTVHQLTPTSVSVHQLTPMGVILLKLTPMGVFLLKLIPMGVTLLKLTPMGVIMHHLLFVFLTRTKKRKKFR